MAIASSEVEHTTVSELSCAESKPVPVQHEKIEKGRNSANHQLALSLRYNIFTTFVTVGRVSGDLCIAAWAGLQSKTLRPDVLMHHLGEFRVAQQSSLRLTGK